MTEEDYAERVVSDRIPKHVYKYKSLAGKSKDHVRDLVVNQRLYFPAPSDLNDPFECRPNLTTSATADQQRRYIDGLVKRMNPEASRPVRRRIAQEVRSDPAKFRATMMASTQATLSAMGVFSLSSNPLDLLMWPHYADNHRGVCVRFDLEALMDAGEMPFPVEYADERPHCDMILEPTVDWLNKAVLTKGRPWEYEREWRIVRNCGGRKVLTLTEHTVDGVLLGANVPEADRALVLQWAQEAGRPVAVGQASFHPTAYELQVESLT